MIEKNFCIGILKNNKYIHHGLLNEVNIMAKKKKKK